MIKYVTMTLTFIASIAILTNLYDVASAVSAGDTNAHFDVVGSVMAVNRSKSPLLILHSSEECMILRDVTQNRQSLPFQPGNIIRAKGCVSVNEYDYPSANCQDLILLDAGTPPEVLDINEVDLTTKSLNGKLIRMHGVVMETDRDEIDPKYVYITIADKGSSFSVSICDDMEHDVFLRSLVDTEISIVSTHLSAITGLRKMSSWELTTYGTNSINILRPAPADPFCVPLLSDVKPAPMTALASMGKRKISGTVTATRRGKDFLIVDEKGTTRLIKPRNPDCPSYGDIVEAVGYPETDLYRLNLVDAIWRGVGHVASNPLAPLDTDISRILTDGKGNRKINPLFHGKAIRVTGNVIDVPSGTRQFETVTLKCGDFSIPVDISANPGLAETMAVGSRLSVAGTCIVETESWRPYSAFPRATGITLVVRHPEDVRIITRPPWWTSKKLLFVVSSLLLALVAFFVWNRILNRLVYKRSRALLKEQLALAEAELKVAERTNLAIELHDSLSQNLSAVAFQILATKSAAKISPDDVVDNLNTAERMLLSCRTELKRCLWDLRNDTLDAKNMSDAMQKVLAPVKGNALLTIRFNVIRSDLDESTFHTVIRIIRELVSNAIQHGHASHVNVVGDLSNSVLSFSVKDDGLGFDVSTAPGPADGHFGLAGVSERVRRHGGKVEIESSPGKGTKVTVKIQP